MLVEFDGIHDGKDSPFDLNGRPHTEHIKDHGHFEDSPWDWIVNYRKVWIGLSPTTYCLIPRRFAIISDSSFDESFTHPLYFPVATANHNPEEPSTAVDINLCIGGGAIQRCYNTKKQISTISELG